MKKFNLIKIDKLKTTFLVLRILILLLCSAPIVSFIFGVKLQKQISHPKTLLTYIIALLLPIILTILGMLIKNRKDRYKLVFILNMIILCCIGVTSAVFIGYVPSYYKFVFVFIIVHSTMELGMGVGMFSAFCSATVLLTIDLLFVKPQINMNLENDFAMCIMYIVVAWILGCFAKIEDPQAFGQIDYAQIDGLTNVYSHSYFFQSLKQCCEESLCLQKPLSLLILDIDYFRIYNDIFGHSQGDAVLKELALILVDFFRQDRIICRYGGEQFAVILIDTDIDRSAVIANKLREYAAKYVFPGQEKLPNKNLTISVGVSHLRKSDDNYTNLVKRTELALNRAKYLRRNSIEVYTSIFEEFSQVSINNNGLEETLLSLKTLISVINSRDSYTFDHTERVVQLCSLVADYMKLPSKDKKLLCYAAYLHDLGKVNIAKEVLISDKKLSAEEWEQLKRHPDDGATIINEVEGLEKIAPIVRQHHERYDGNGYPNCLKGSQIDYLARILVIADSFDAATNIRPYKKALTYRQAFEEIDKCSGTQFDPEISKVFIDAVRTYCGEYLDVV